MNVLVTGGCGYNGSMLAVELASAGHNVFCLDTAPKPVNWGFWEPRNSGAGDVVFMQGNVLDSSLWRSIASQTQAIVHLAFLVGGPACDKDPDYAETLAVQGTRNVLHASEGKRMVIFPSSDAVYGNNAPEMCGEDVPCEPPQLYGKLKLGCEHMIRSAGGNFVIFRLPTNFGVAPTMRYSLLVHCLAAEAFRTGNINVTEGRTIRTIAHVRDVARAVRFVLENQDKVRGGVFNIATDSLTKSKMAEIIANEFVSVVTADEKGPSQKDKRNFVLDCSKIQALGWRPAYSFRGAIQRLYDYMKSTLPCQSPE